jgi:hypothetical protein
MALCHARPELLEANGFSNSSWEKDQNVNISNLKLGTITLDSSDVMNFVVSGPTVVKASAIILKF